MKLYRGCRKLKKKRIIPAFLVLCVIFAIVPRPGAAAAGMSGLEVIGQTAMTQQTFTDLSIIGANSAGLIDAINSAKNPAQSIGEWIKEGWDSWLLRQQLTWGTVLNIAAAGARYTSNGDLLFNSQLSDLFTRFYNWLWDGEDGPNIKENATTAPVFNRNNMYYPNYVYNINTIHGSHIRVYLDRPNSRNYFEYTVVNGDPDRIFYALYEYPSGGLRTIWFSDKPFTLKYQEFLPNAQSPETRTPSSYGGKTGDLPLYFMPSVSGDYTRKTYIDGLSPTVVTNGGNKVSLNNQIEWDIAYQVLTIGDDQILGDPDKLGGLTGSERKKLAPPDLLDFPDFGGNGGTIDINDYIGGLSGAIGSQDGTADVNITDSQGVVSAETMTIDQTTDITAETETTSDAVNQGELISTATPSTELADYTIDLRNYFPFCIPWNLYDMITLLVADPVAPHVQYPFVIEPLNVNYTIDLDFSQFDSVAAVLRTMELLAAGIGLALMTKRLIQGGD